MAALKRHRRAESRRAGSVDLIGPEWGDWRGRWCGNRSLVEHDGSWVLEIDGRQTESWPDFPTAVQALWETRRNSDRSPFLIGWLGYEESARLAGGLPSHGTDSTVPGGWWLIEPTAETVGKGDDTPGGPFDGELRWSLDGDTFCGRIERIRELIASGAVYQVNLCRRASLSGASITLDAFAEAASRGQMPPYLARIDFGSGELLCASMELLLRSRGRDLETRPIKGTRRRGVTPSEDRRLAEELDGDPKERAELAMVVDLERNDLGRVCETGSVKVDDPGSVHSYATVHHLVARVTGRGLEALKWWEALAAMVPGGSITGCPKRAAMEVILELEPVPRGPFTGALGVVAHNGDMEMALPIRTAWKIDTTIDFAAGCGIVWQSDPVSEEEESRLKVTRWLDLIGGGR